MKSGKGFTFVELLVAMAILAIIVAIAVPVYTSQVEKTRRADAIAGLTGAAQQLERCYTRTNTYANCLDSPFNSPDDFYNITIDLQNGGETGFELTATAQGAQTGDSCSPFELDHRGNRDAGSETDRCWGSN